MTCAGHRRLDLHFPIPRTAIWAIKSSGLDGVVDMRPRSMLSSYEPTMAACRERGEASVPSDDRRAARIMFGVGGDNIASPPLRKLKDRLGWCACVGKDPCRLWVGMLEYDDILAEGDA